MDPKQHCYGLFMYAVNAYGFSADNRRSCLPMHWKSITQRHWADIILAFEWFICGELQTYTTSLIMMLLFQLVTVLYKFLSPNIYLLIYFVLYSYRNIWNEDEERIGLGRYCERGDNVSAMHYARCPLGILFVWSHSHCFVLTGLFSRSGCHQMFEFS